MKQIKTESIPELEEFGNLPKDSEIFINKAFAISSRIYRLMKQNDWLQKDLAEKLGKSHPEVSKLLSGTQNFTLRTISKIEALFKQELIKVPDEMESFPIETNLNGTYYIEKNISRQENHEWKEAKVIPFNKEVQKTEGKAV